MNKSNTNVNPVHSCTPLTLKDGLVVIGQGIQGNQGETVVWGALNQLEST